MRPIIAVTTTIWPGGVYGLPRVQLDAQYMTAVEEHGATPVLLTPGHGDGAVRHLLGMADGLLVSGGEDVDPHSYGAERGEHLIDVNPPRDALELAAVRAAVARDLPVLAVCRGMQVLNVAMGGTLIQDIPTEHPGELRHQQEAPLGRRWHDARLKPGSLLARSTGVEALHINSFHHQGVAALGAGLETVAWAEDGIVEGVEAPDRTWVLGVQWHPERRDADAPAEAGDPDRRLFAAFAEAAKRYARTAGKAPVHAAFV